MKRRKRRKRRTKTRTLATRPADEFSAFDTQSDRAALIGVGRSFQQRAEDEEEEEEGEEEDGEEEEGEEDEEEEEGEEDGEGLSLRFHFVTK
ncbi:uncharacterized protein V6R79_012310 [Siganus canaliculatus]